MQSLEKIGTSAPFHSSRIEDDPRWCAVERILASQNFSKSGRLSAFLTYICRCALEERSEEITEQQIGIHVFGRPADYNPGDDNIVRTTARQLRQRLALYYQEEGGGDDIRIEVPKGGYHPSFIRLNDYAAAGELTKAEVDTPTLGYRASPSQTVPEAARSQRRSAWSLGLALICGAIVALLGQHVVHRFTRRPVVNPVWATVFASGRPTIFVSGDAGLNMYDNLARTQVKLGDYVTGAYLATPAAQPPAGYTWASLATRRYVSWVDLTLADQLRQVAGLTGTNYSIRFARDVRTEDFRNANAVLVGAPTYNPWVEMFDSHLNFHLQYDGERNSVSVLNSKPSSGEPAEYLPSAEDPTQRGYTHGFGYIALTHNLDGSGRVLLVEGSTIAGVDAAISFLQNDAKMDPILKRASHEGALADFEVLLAANFLKSSSPDAEVLAVRYPGLDQKAR